VSQHGVRVDHELGASPDRVWAAITDHEGMGRWLDARVSLLARSANGGVGTVRRVHARGLRIDEEVVYADAPVGDRPGRLVYRIVRGLPVRFHRGEMLVERVGDGRSRLTWDVVLSSAVPGLARASAFALRPALARGLRNLDALLSAAERG
jgi:hypothetical protein